MRGDEQHKPSHSRRVLIHAHTLRFQVKNFDPVAEAFKVYDPSNTGFVDTEVLREIFQSLGFGEITDDGKRDACHRIAI